MSSQSIDRVSTGSDTGFYEIKNGEDFTEYGTVVATEEAVYGAQGAADLGDFEPHYDEDRVEVIGGSRSDNGWATGNAKDPEKMNEILAMLGSDKRVNPEGVVFEEGWSTDLPDDYLDQDLDDSATSGRNALIERASYNFEQENGF